MRSYNDKQLFHIVIPRARNNYTRQQYGLFETRSVRTPRHRYRLMTLSARAFTVSSISSSVLPLPLFLSPFGARIKEKLISRSAPVEEGKTRGSRNDPSFRGWYLETPRVQDDRDGGRSPLKGASARKFSRKGKICNSTGVERGIQLSVPKERRDTAKAGLSNQRRAPGRGGGEGEGSRRKEV